MAYQSGFSSDIEDMLTIRHRSGFKLEAVERHLKVFDSFCAEKYPKASLLTREIAEEWIHSSEIPSRCHLEMRVRSMKHLGRYQRSLGLDAYVPEYRIKIPKAEEPHLFSNEQLKVFFNAVDTKMTPTEVYPYKDALFPVFFRLMYSCGLRCSEACNLRVEDVDLEHGVISIYRAKGNRDRRLMMSDDMAELCRRFDRYYQQLLPDRKYFFQPSREYERLKSNSVGKVFEALLKCSGLDQVPGKNFTLHGLRHLFAVQNIRKCAEAGEDFNNWIQYLSRYMGHKRIQYTLYYLHLTSQLFPAYRDKLNKLMEGIGVVYAED